MAHMKFYYYNVTDILILYREIWLSGSLLELKEKLVKEEREFL